VGRDARGDRAAAAWLAWHAGLDRAIRVPRCSVCATVFEGLAQRCTACGAVMRGDIAQLSDRLAAEDQLQDAEDRAAT
jgi:formate dehydrogenase maturation protein FdhE